MLVFLLGIKAVGKSRLVKELNSMLGKPITEISYGDMMLKIAMEQLGVQDRDSIAKLAPSEQNRIREEAAKAIRILGESEPVVFLNTHGFIYTMPHHTYLPGSPDSVSELLNPGMILLVEASPGVIISRREKDQKSGRNREIGTTAEVADSLELERMSAVHLSSKFGIQLKLFDNSRPIEDARAEVTSLSELFKSL